MNLSDAFKSIIKPHETDKLLPLTTTFGETLSPDNVLPEYPRPQMRRDSFLSLNGHWDYAITDTTDFPSKYDGKILVPFSPECTLSGVNRQLQPSEFLWYRTFLPSIDRSPSRDTRFILHFDAVDYRAEVYLNDSHIASHKGGYLPFQIDITDFLKADKNELTVMVQDTTDLESQARGKQSLHRGGIFYTAQSGIWQSVWLEQVPISHLEGIWFETDYDARRVTAHITAVTGAELPTLSLSVFENKTEIVNQSLALTAPHTSMQPPAPKGNEMRTLSASLSFAGR